MARLRYVKSNSGEGKANAGGSKIHHSVQSIRALYETEPEIAKAVLPRPLEPASAPEIFVQFANVAMHFSEERTVQIGAATVGVACSYEGRPGYYVLAMPMEGEFVVIGGREKYGEPKKLAETSFSIDGDHVNAKVTRHGVTFLELDGKIGEPSDAPKQFTEYFYCYKALPAAVPEAHDNGGFDGDVLLTLLTWERDYSSVRQIEDGRIILRESPHDPLVDVPVKRLIRMELAEGASRTGGEVLRSVPGEWLQPFLVQRYDDPQEGIEVALASEGHS
ncbi:MAG: acetoacetate decarboxylase family protein [Polyangiales bacterium]